ncbi:hypothetical protein [Desertivirga brevis]|uniref:hypothetical protein n=1 Tax=Desertivirga brevis TaxID=2810310 RepID=UPI001A965DA6|nr:hypothetical protein [Pedobacter sp. SYSU D00873]
MTYWKLPLVAIALVTSTLFSCQSNKDEETTTLHTQSFEIKIDGKVIKMAPDKPTDGTVVLSAFVQGSERNSLSISATHKLEDFQFGIDLRQIPSLVPGVYPVFKCHEAGAECEDDYQSALIGRFPSSQEALLSGKLAYQSPKLGLKPLMLTISNVEDAYWEGVGKVKKIKGSFEGTLARLERNANNVTTIAEATKVEGSFDLYCLVQKTE